MHMTKDIETLWHIAAISAMTFAFATSCVQPQQQKIEAGILVGDWELEHNGNDVAAYPAISFGKDSTAIFYSPGDTVYRYNYAIKNDTVMLTDIFGKTSLGIIRKLDNRTLVFDRLAECGKPLHYCKPGRK